MKTNNFVNKRWMDWGKVILVMLNVKFLMTIRRLANKCQKIQKKNDSNQNRIVLKINFIHYSVSKFIIIIFLLSLINCLAFSNNFLEFISL